MSILPPMSPSLRTSFHSLRSRYRALFSIEEIEQQPIVQWSFGAMLFYFFVTFFTWINRSNITVETAQSGPVCWPYFPNCGDFFFLHVLPYGYSQSTLYMLFYGVMMLIVYYMWKKEWVYAHLWMVPLFLWKILVIFVLSYNSGGPYDYYHLLLTAALLFAPHKEYFLKVIFVFCYFMSVTVKFTPAWIVGTYFTSMETGAPWMPEWFVVIATNIVIFVQIVECWFLLSRNWILQRLSFAFAMFFHLYSGILVGYDYPSVTLPIIAILFGPLYRHTPTPFTRKAIVGWSILALMALFQLLGFVIPTNRYLTLEGNRLGMFMFEANHQCVVTISRHFSTGQLDSENDFESPAGTACSGFYCLVKRKTIKNGDGTIQQTRLESGTAWNRCDPYEWWSRLHKRCSGNRSPDRIEVQFDHSINGEPFYRIIDVPNICDVEYKPLVHNSWIKFPPEAKVVGYPVQNWYHY
jgi:hypothetical protein